MVMAVGILGLISTAMLLNDPPSSSEMETVPAIFEMNSAKLSQVAQRNIASAEGSDSPNPTLIELKCQEENQNIETSQMRLRLKGESCLSEKSTSTRVKNNSNGYIATVFHKPDFSFTTDYINLSEGKNEIDISMETPEGTSVKKVIINRAVSSVRK